MTYDECNSLNERNRKRREWICRRAWLIQMAIQWGGWILAAALALALYIAQVR